MKQRTSILLFVLIGLLLVACMSSKPTGGDNMSKSFAQISQEEAKRMMERDDGHIVLDVRRQDEYDAGHIPGAVCLPNESIGEKQPEILPDLTQTILIYCRSGNRSKQAARKLTDLGFTNVYEFGGILDWTGEISTEASAAAEAPKTASLSFESFDGGGPEYSISLDQPDIVSYRYSQTYADSDHEQMTGAGYTVTYIFSGKKPGETRLTVSARSPIADNFEKTYLVTVDDSLNVSLEEAAQQAAQPAPILVIEANNRTFYAHFENNSSSDALIEQLSAGEISVKMHDYGGFEKVGELPWELPRNDVPITTKPGDVILYQGNQITVYYDENTWSLTKLARIEGITGEELLDAFGEGAVTVTFCVEWSE